MCALGMTISFLVDALIADTVLILGHYHKYEPLDKGAQKKAGISYMVLDA